MARKPHPADIADREQIAQAVSFTAFLRRSPFDKIVHQHHCLADAVADAAAIRAANPGRDCLVYAITATGASIPVPKDMQASALAQARAA